MKHVVMRMTIVVLLVVGAVSGQETTGAIIGAIISQDGVPLPGVRVQLVDPERGLEWSAVSDPMGSYAFRALAPAQYELTAGLAGFRTINVPIRVALGHTVTSDLVMEVGEFTETIAVTADAPLVDVTSTVAGMAVSTDDLLAAVPVQREVTHIALLAPGTYAADPVYQEPFWHPLDTPGQGFVSFSGSSYGENSYQVNGLNITNFRTMMGSSFVPMAFVDEVQVKTGGYQAEFGRATGGVINMVTKSGTNILRGAFSAYSEPESLQTQSPDTLYQHHQEEGRETLEANASLGGPLLRDRLFYFAFVRYSDAWATDYYANVWTAERHESSAPYWGAKLDWYVTPRHHLEGTYLSDEVDVDYTRYGYDGDSRTLLEPWGTGVFRRGGGNLILKYSGLLSPALLLSAQAGRNEFDRTNSSTGDDCPVVWDRREGEWVPLGCWVGQSRGVDDDARDAYRVDLDWLLGSHGLRAGADYELNVASSAIDYSGGAYYEYRLNGSEGQDAADYNFPDLPWDQNLAWVGTWSNGGRFEVESRAAYVQDSWKVAPSLTLNLGVRWEAYDNRNGLGGTFIATDNQWAPRLGLVWDPSEQGRSRLYASFGTYHLPVSAEVNIRFAGALYSDGGFYAFDGNLAADGSPVVLDEQLTYSISADGVTPDPRENISDNFEPMAQNEVSLGYERQLGGAWTVGVRGVARWYEQVIEDYTLYQGLWSTYAVPCLNPDLLYTDDYCWEGGWRLGNPGRDFEGWYDVDGDGELDRVHIPASALGYPAAERKYYALELSFDRRFSDRWMLHGSYTWSHLYGNYEGTISDEFLNDAAGMTQSFDYPYMMEHSSGDLPGDMRHIVKLYGAYAWDFGLQVGANVSFQTGRPINSYGRHPSDPWAPFSGYLSFYTGGEPRPRGCCGRTDDISALDLMVGYDFRALGLDWNVRLDGFNVLNNHGMLWPQIQAEDVWNGDAFVDYGEPQGLQPPRTVRLGLGASF